MGLEHSNPVRRNEALLKQTNFGDGACERILCANKISSNGSSAHSDAEANLNSASGQLLCGEDRGSVVQARISDTMKSLSAFVRENLRAYVSIGFTGVKPGAVDLSVLLTVLRSSLDCLEELSFASESSVRDGVDESSVASAASAHIDGLISLLTEQKFESSLKESEHEFVLMSALGLREELAELYYQTALVEARNRMNNEAAMLADRINEEIQEISIAALAALHPGGVVDRSFLRLKEILSGEFPALQGIAQRVHHVGKVFLRKARSEESPALGFHTEPTSGPDWNISGLVQDLKQLRYELSRICFDDSLESHYDLQLRAFSHSLLTFTEAFLIRVVRSAREDGYPGNELSGLQQSAARMMECAADVARQSIAFIQQLEDNLKEAS